MLQTANRQGFIDPVCGMQVDPDHAAASTVHEGQQIYFCAEGCLRAFEKNPQKYLSGEHHKPMRRRFLDWLARGSASQPPKCCG